ncbi:hypothetical protein N7457_005618 [Penicillium paradoxum]|uniref:uncharacterized protein n=1 Tax=Penicillium paradoxum TaxID=176176 RepID=UPI002547EF51|nr:uncharacterized protein N7457_005618 [Penicillium paradoxum]KAJ5780458.1 hypothetical protein N7457_005618 [Penicillium paradoxum]
MDFPSNNAEASEEGNGLNDLESWISFPSSQPSIGEYNPLSCFSLPSAYASSYTTSHGVVQDSGMFSTESSSQLTERPERHEDEFDYMIPEPVPFNELPQHINISRNEEERTYAPQPVPGPSSRLNRTMMGILEEVPSFPQPPPEDAIARTATTYRMLMSEQIDPLHHVSQCIQELETMASCLRSKFLASSNPVAGSRNQTKEQFRSCGNAPNHAAAKAPSGEIGYFLVLEMHRPTEIGHITAATAGGTAEAMAEAVAEMAMVLSLVDQKIRTVKLRIIPKIHQEIRQDTPVILIRVSEAPGTGAMQDQGPYRTLPRTIGSILAPVTTSQMELRGSLRNLSLDRTTEFPKLISQSKSASAWGNKRNHQNKGRPLSGYAEGVAMI